MSNKKIIIGAAIILLLAAVAATAFWFYQTKTPAGQTNRLESLKTEHPEWASYIDNVIKWQGELAKDQNNIENYTTLGLFWKTLADYASSAKLENYKDYYREALNVYEAGIVKAERKNTLLMINAGNMAKYLEDYKLAEDYYKEAISVSPGDATYYVSLAELYEYEMKKTKEEVIAIYDEGLKRTLDVGFLQKRKESYLKRVEELNKQ